MPHINSSTYAAIKNIETHINNHIITEILFISYTSNMPLPLLFLNCNEELFMDNLLFTNHFKECVDPIYVNSKCA